MLQVPKVDEEKPPGTEDDPEVEGSAPDPAAAAAAAAQVAPSLAFSAPRWALHPSLASAEYVPAIKAHSSRPAL